MKKELAFGETRIKKLKTSNFLSFLWCSFRTWDVFVYIILHKQSCQQNSHLDIVTISQKYRAASWQWLLSNNIVQDLALACSTYLLLGKFCQGLSYITTILTETATNGMKIWSLLSDLIIKVQKLWGKSGHLTR